jgi:putative hydrolase of the HAD superfamily
VSAGDRRAAVRAVTFDYWNTIVRPTEAQLLLRIKAWQNRYERAGVDVDEELLRGTFAAVWDEHQAAWRRNEQYTGSTAALRAIELIGRAIDSTTQADLVEAFITPAPELSLCDGVATLIGALTARGIRLGIICDVGCTPSTALRRVLDGHALLGRFAGWSFSDDVGWYKPAPEIFHHALGYLGAPPDQVAHIGDLRRTDVAGARGMGMIAVRYRGAYDDTSDGPEGDHVVDHHDHVLDALGL